MKQTVARTTKRKGGQRRTARRAGVGSQIVRATLKSGGSPVAGQTVSFTDGSTALCTAITNAKGVARCTISAINQSLLYRTNIYTATFAGSAGYKSSTSTTLVVTFIV